MPSPYPNSCTNQIAWKVLKSKIWREREMALNLATLSKNEINPCELASS